MLRRLVIPDGPALGAALTEFTLFYNHVRPHQNLGGATPAEAWNGAPLHDQAGKQALLVEALDGLLVGYHMRR